MFRKIRGEIEPASHDSYLSDAARTLSHVRAADRPFLPSNLISKHVNSYNGYTSTLDHLDRLANPSTLYKTYDHETRAKAKVLQDIDSKFQEPSSVRDNLGGLRNTLLLGGGALGAGEMAATAANFEFYSRPLDIMTALAILGIAKARRIIKIHAAQDSVTAEANKMIKVARSNERTIQYKLFPKECDLIPSDFPDYDHVEGVVRKLFGKASPDEIGALVLPLLDQLYELTQQIHSLHTIYSDIQSEQDRINKEASYFNSKSENGLELQQAATLAESQINELLTVYKDTFSQLEDLREAFAIHRQWEKTQEKLGQLTQLETDINHINPLHMKLKHHAHEKLSSLANESSTRQLEGAKRYYHIVASVVAKVTEICDHLTEEKNLEAAKAKVDTHIDSLTKTTPKTKPTPQENNTQKHRKLFSTR